jgi:hypothetical protein
VKPAAVANTLVDFHDASPIADPVAVIFLFNGYRSQLPAALLILLDARIRIFFSNDYPGLDGIKPVVEKMGVTLGRRMQKLRRRGNGFHGVVSCLAL